MKYAPCSVCGGRVVERPITLTSWEEEDPEDKEIVAGVCENCGEVYFDTSSTKEKAEFDI